MRVSVWMVVLLSISAPGGGDGRRYERVERSGGRSDAGAGGRHQHASLPPHIWHSAF